jgi:hypothetical protein
MLFLTLVSLVVASGNQFPDDNSDNETRRSRKNRSASVTSIEKGRRTKTD